MNRLRAGSLAGLLVSTGGIVYALIFNPEPWIVYGLAIFLIPLFILSLGILSMAKPVKEEAEERVNEPFIGY